jgi:hypothetical protein
MEVSGQLHLRVKAFGTDWKGSWMGPRAGLDAVVKTENSCPCRESKSGSPDRSLGTILTQLPRLGGYGKRRGMHIKFYGEGVVRTSTWKNGKKWAYNI